MHSENLSQKAKPLSDKDLTFTEQVSPVVLKQCSKCKEYKALDLFYNNKSYKYGKYAYCKSCHGEKVSAYQKANPEKHAAKNRAWQKANPEKEAARIRAYRKANPEKSMLIHAKSRAKKNKLPFNLELEDIRIPSVCPILGLVLEHGNTYENRASSPSLDKIHNEKEYVKGNVHVVSNRFNLLKKDATLAELILMGKWAEQQEPLEAA